MQLSRFLDPYKILFLPVLFISMLYTQGCDNTIIENEQNVNAAWGDVQSQYQRRADLIPNLVETVKAAAATEKNILESVIQARNQAGTLKLSVQDLSDPQKLQQFQAAQTQLSQSLKQIFALSERYPEVKSNQNFRDLQIQIEGTENRIQRTRQVYNEAVKEYNSSILKWPGRWFAGSRQPKEVFQAESGTEKAPHIKF